MLRLTPTELLTQAAVALAVVTVLAAILSWLVAGRVLRPIRLISATAVHELRPPLTTMRIAPDVTLDGEPTLLEPFVRGDGSRTLGDGGLGLGLSIVAAVAAAHGGTIAVTPRPAGGLDVTARLPRGRDSPGPEAAVSGPAVLPSRDAAGYEAGATEIDLTSR